MNSIIIGLCFIAILACSSNNSSSNETPYDYINISLDNDNNVYLNEKEIELCDLESNLRTLESSFIHDTTIVRIIAPSQTGIRTINCI